MVLITDIDWITGMDMNQHDTASLVGTWRLLSWLRAAADGGQEPNWDEHPLGLLVSTADGTMSAQLYDSRRPPLGGAMGSGDSRGGPYWLCWHGQLLRQL